MATMNEKTMTMREFLTAVAEGKPVTGEVAEFAQAELVKMDEANAKRRAKANEKAAAKAAEEAPLYEALEAALTEKLQSATDLMGVIEKTRQKTSRMLNDLVEAGKAKTEPMKVKVDGKTHTVKGYARV